MFMALILITYFYILEKYTEQINSSHEHISFGKIHQNILIHSFSFKSTTNVKAKKKEKKHKVCSSHN
jgi:hypothetical protein